MSLKYRVDLPPATATDEGSRELSVTLGSEAPVVVSLPGDAVAYDLVCERDVAVALSLCDIDTSGNKSDPSTLAFTSKDTIPPNRPGELSVTLTEQS